MDKHTRQNFSRDFLIRFYPDYANRSAHELIGTRRLEKEVDNPATLNNIIKRVEKNDQHKTVIRLRRGVEFVFVYR